MEAYSWTAKEPTRNDSTDSIGRIDQPYQVRISLLQAGRVSLTSDIVGSDSLSYKDPYSIEVEPLKPVVGALRRVEDRGIVAVENHAHGRHEGDVPAQS